MNGSARKDSNTAIMLNVVLEELNKQGIETELYQLAGKQMRGCLACYKCMENKDPRCAVKKDEEALVTMKVLEENMGWLIRQLNG